MSEYEDLFKAICERGLNKESPLEIMLVHNVTRTPVYNLCGKYEYQILRELITDYLNLQSENAALRERLEKAIETPCEDGDVFYRFFWHPNEMVEDMACGFRKEKDGEIYVCSAYSESWYNIKDCEFSLKAAKARLKRMQKKLQGD